MTTGYWASLYKWGIDGKRMEELVVTETNIPERMGLKTDSNGSALCRIDFTCPASQQLHLRDMIERVGMPQEDLSQSSLAFSYSRGSADVLRTRIPRPRQAEQIVSHR